MNIGAHDVEEMFLDLKDISSSKKFNRVKQINHQSSSMLNNCKDYYLSDTSLCSLINDEVD